MAYEPDFVKFMKCERKHYIFCGPNALRHAMSFAQRKRLCKNNGEAYEYRPGLQQAMSWAVNEAGLQTQSKVSGSEIIGEGVHAKIYTLQNNGHIFASQNNGSSPLYEFAIYYPPETRWGKLLTGKGSMRAFVNSVFRSAKSYQKWFKVNKVFPYKG